LFAHVGPPEYEPGQCPFTSHPPKYCVYFTEYWHPEGQLVSTEQLLTMHPVGHWMQSGPNSPVLPTAAPLRVVDVELAAASTLVGSNRPKPTPANDAPAATWPTQLMKLRRERAGGIRSCPVPSDVLSAIDSSVLPFLLLLRMKTAHGLRLKTRERWV